jgi:hypothetical protein
MKKMTTLLSLVVFLLGVTQSSAQCNWSTKVVLDQHANGQPGLTAFKGPDGVTRLFLTWGEYGNDQLDSMVSTNGVNWTNKLVLPQFPRVQPFHGGGVAMTASTTCGYAYVVWRGKNTNTLYAARSNLGTGWDGAYFIYNPSYAPPGLMGDNSALPIGFAFVKYNSSTTRYDVLKGKFQCNFSSPQLINDGCFFNKVNGVCPFPANQLGAWSPTWTGANGTTELRGFAVGAQQLINYQINSNTPQGCGTHWTNNGLAGAVNPANGTPYLAWTCMEGGGDTCKGSDEVHKINLWNGNTGVIKICQTGEWSYYMPAITFFNGKIWLAWLGANSHINVASLNPF